MSAASQVPPGFRFHPTDEELVNYYLRKKVNFEKFDLDVIRDVDLNKLEPWDLHERCRIDASQHTEEWYFFSHKDKKYPTGTRTNRATAAGFWKATGRDKAVHTGGGFQRIGMRKTLVFYRGRAPHGQKTDWIMHEYRLEESSPSDPSPTSSFATSRGNEEGWVVCRVFKKRMHHHKPTTTVTPVHQDQHHQSHTFMNHVTSEEEQSSLIDNFSHLDYYHSSLQADINIHGSATTILNSFTCKPEVVDYDEDGHFLHLPQLESPKETSDNAPNYSQDKHHAYKGRTNYVESLYCKRSPAFSSSYSLMMPMDSALPTLDTNTSICTKSLFSCEDSLARAYNEENDEWGVFESLKQEIKYNPNIDHENNEYQFSNHNNHLVTPSSFTCNTTDLPSLPLIHATKQDPYPDSDVWSFPK